MSITSYGAPAKTFDILPGVEVKRWTYIKGPQAARRLDNLLKLAREEKGGNWAALVNETLNAYWNLDPETGERLPGRPKCFCGCDCGKKPEFTPPVLPQAKKRYSMEIKKRTDK